MSYTQTLTELQSAKSVQWGVVVSGFPSPLHSRPIYASHLPGGPHMGSRPSRERRKQRTSCMHCVLDTCTCACARMRTAALNTTPQPRYPDSSDGSYCRVRATNLLFVYTCTQVCIYIYIYIIHLYIYICVCIHIYIYILECSRAHPRTEKMCTPLAMW